LPNYGLGLSEALNRSILADLERAPPDLVIIDAETWAIAGPGEPIREWISSHYRNVGSRHHFALAAAITNQ